ncbi:ATP synthase subunit C lysine N-methyltransferase isoform X4 [Meriones unguiculatus]|uniref:ATP synthase subunit C lysine N-methyltransferase isoform X4 n=1 Tax=Meriones unguiculatus TaxID=10047 RepID=UPI00293E468F|nr:ATP synthase subunit C lysine N-methyltransferase isoform X4 [Meriones unguiculatus]
MERGEMPEEERQSGRVLPTSLESENLKKSNWGFLLTGIIGGALVTVYAVATPFITPALRKVCLPFVPATSKQIENVVKMLQHRRGSLVDIGSGDGRIVTFAQYSNVVIFGVPQMMPQLEKKLELELEDDARVIACRFPFPHWTPDYTAGEGIDTVWAYDMSAFRGRGKRARACMHHPAELHGGS